METPITDKHSYNVEEFHAGEKVVSARIAKELEMELKQARKALRESQEYAQGLESRGVNLAQASQKLIQAYERKNNIIEKLLTAWNLTDCHKLH